MIWGASSAVRALRQWQMGSRGLRRPSSGASRHLLPVNAGRGVRVPFAPRLRLFDSHISAGQFRAIFDGVKFLQPAIEDAWSWFAVVSGPGAEAGDDPCGEGHCSFWVRVGLAFCRIGSLVIGADGLDQGLITF